MLWMFTWNEMKLNEWKTLFKCQQYLALKKKKLIENTFSTKNIP